VGPLPVTAGKIPHLAREEQGHGRVPWRGALSRTEPLVRAALPANVDRCLSPVRLLLNQRRSDPQYLDYRDKCASASMLSAWSSKKLDRQNARHATTRLALCSSLTESP
jgi:hypothetical protein